MAAPRSAVKTHVPNTYEAAMVSLSALRHPMLTRSAAYEVGPLTWNRRLLVILQPVNIGWRSALNETMASS